MIQSLSLSQMMAQVKIFLIQGRKLFKCPYENCQKIFKEKGNLKTHIRVHVKKIFNLDWR